MVCWLLLESQSATAADVKVVRPTEDYRMDDRDDDVATDEAEQGYSIGSKGPACPRVRAGMKPDPGMRPIVSGAVTANQQTVVLLTFPEGNIEWLEVGQSSWGWTVLSISGLVVLVKRCGQEMLAVLPGEPNSRMVQNQVVDGNSPTERQTFEWNRMSLNKTFPAPSLTQQ